MAKIVRLKKGLPKTHIKATYDDRKTSGYLVHNEYCMYKWLWSYRYFYPCFVPSVVLFMIESD